MVQPIKNKYGEMKCHKIIYGISKRQENVKGGSVAILENGSWAYFPSGNPIEDPDDVLRLLREVNPALIPTFNQWWARKEELEAAENNPPARAIEFTSDNRLVYKDTGEEVTSAEDLHNYFEPGPVRELAFRLFVEAEALRSQADEKARGSLYESNTPEKQEQIADAFKILPSGKSKANA